ncbi:hypothetical protein CDAR_104331 [Caerostris darwini]|uniref:Uncharacterized protein n=1 Tax=Caerostris darwini TaxID=1538125 RepID=A0AAV4PUL9_9ARAC|nr:hypothetical protein CDAR_104331 [Caerostris darwini]
MSPDGTVSIPPPPRWLSGVPQRYCKLAKDDPDLCTWWLKVLEAWNSKCSRRHRRRHYYNEKKEHKYLYENRDRNCGRH